MKLGKTDSYIPALQFPTFNRSPHPRPQTLEYMVPLPATSCSVPFILISINILIEQPWPSTCERHFIREIRDD